MTKSDLTWLTTTDLDHGQVADLRFRRGADPNVRTNESLPLVGDGGTLKMVQGEGGPEGQLLRPIYQRIRDSLQTQLPVAPATG